MNEALVRCYSQGLNGLLSCQRHVPVGHLLNHLSICPALLLYIVIFGFKKAEVDGVPGDHGKG